MARSSEPVIMTDSVPSGLPAAQRRSSKWIFFVASRYLRTRRRERRNVTAFLSILGLAVGVAVLITVLAVMNAFQLKTIESILSFGSYHLRLSGVSAQRLLDVPSRLDELRDKVPEIQAAVQFVDLQGIAKGYYSNSQGISIRAFPPDVLHRDRDLASHMIIDSGDFDIGRPMTVVLGSDLARNLGVGKGNRISVVTLSSNENAGPTQTSLLVTGTFQVGYYEYDSNFAFVSLDTGVSLAGTLVDRHIGIKLADRDADYRAMADIEKALVDRKLSSRAVLSRDLVSWREYNSAIFGALRVEKLMMIFIIGLIFVVVAVNIFHDLRRSVFEKTEDIGVLRALGAPAGTIQLIFILEGCVIGLVGGILGLGLGWLLATHVSDVFSAAENLATWVRDFVSGIAGKSPSGERVSLFFLDTVPSRPIFHEALAISIVAFLSAAVAALAASRRVSGIKPAEILRND